MDSKNNEIFKKFEEKYKRFILPKCEKLDIERMKINRQNFIIIFLYVAIVFYMLAFVFSDLDKDTITVSVFFSIFPPIVYIALRYTKFTNKIKREIINYFCASFEDLRWLDKKNYPSFQTVNTVLKDGHLFYVDKTISFDYDDIFKGKYNNTPFEIFELCASVYKSYRSRQRKVRRYIFQGAVIHLKLEKDFKNKTVVKLDKIKGFNPESLSAIDYGASMIYTQNRLEAKKLTDEELIEKLEKLKQVFEASNVYCSFYKKDAWIALHMNNTYSLFEVMNSFRNSLVLDVKENFEVMIKQIICIYDLIDYFKKEQIEL